METGAGVLFCIQIIFLSSFVLFLLLDKSMPMMLSVADVSLLDAVATQFIKTLHESNV